MVRLGVGKNMVLAIRFWAEAAEVFEGNGKPTVSENWGAVLREGGYDPYLERIQTLWLIHWHIATNPSGPLFAWHYLLNSWHRSEFTASEALGILLEEAKRRFKKVPSDATMESHFSTFLHTYVPTRGKKGNVAEDNLDCPLVELDLIIRVGDRAQNDGGSREAIYAFRVEDKPEITSDLFHFCVADFWRKQRPNEATLSFKDISVAEGSPGQVFKLPEQSVRERLEALEEDSDGVLVFEESANRQHVVRRRESSAAALLRRIYRAN